MAVQTGTGKNAKPPGAPATLKQGTRPAGETYKSPPGRTTRGGLGAVRKDPITGGDVARTGYGQNQFSGASSAGVEESSKLSDFDITVNDPALDKIVKQGVGSKTNDAPQAQTGQERSISDAPIPPAFGHRNRTINDGSPGGGVPGTGNRIGSNNSAFADELAAKQHGRK
jgi:hypothetical protein